MHLMLSSWRKTVREGLTLATYDLKTIASVAAKLKHRGKIRVAFFGCSRYKRAFQYEPLTRFIWRRPAIGFLLTRCLKEKGKT